MGHSHVLSPPLRTQPPPIAYQQPPPATPSSSSDTSFPILAISILGILTTGILLVSYYVFVIKCCLNWRRPDVIARLSSSSRFRRRRWREEDLFTVYAATSESRGLEEAVIRAIPTFRFHKGSDGDGIGGGEKAGLLHECAVCLNEFEEGERLRRLPGCAHAFHIDCIDTWLQSSANCPLCRSEVAISADPVVVAHREPLHEGGSVVIEVGDDDGSDEQQQQQPGAPAEQGQKPSPPRKGRKLQHVASMGDECIDVRVGKDEGFFGVQPIRRSFSMDSSCDRQLYLSIQEILHRNPHFYSQQEMASGEGCSNAGAGASGAGGLPHAARVRRSFFSFGRTSRRAVLPVTVEP
uniref:RING-type E3 ubiquitin transferase n=1 Tax=Anthurium amnicola TaxID=1678845 RepID=A0A1D1Y6I1_9ARAE